MDGEDMWIDRIEGNPVEVIVDHRQIVQNPTTAFMPVFGSIIRCKDCLRYDTHDLRCKQWNYRVRLSDFCSYGERRWEQ